MNKDLKKQKFIELRAEELSLDKISKIIEVSKPTLIKWCGELHLEIHNQKTLNIDAVKDEFQITREAHLKLLSSILMNVEKELTTRNLSTLAVDKLFALYKDLKAQLAQELDITYKEKTSESFSLEGAYYERTFKL